jgi:hypothetical protein
LAKTDPVAGLAGQSLEYALEIRDFVHPQFLTHILGAVLQEAIDPLC